MCSVDTVGLFLQSMNICLKWIFSVRLYKCDFKIKVHCLKTIYTIEIHFRAYVDDGNTMLIQKH